MNYKVENTGYKNSQVVEGFLVLSVDGVDGLVFINVYEVTTELDHEVSMSLEFIGKSESHKKQVIEKLNLKFSEQYDCYEISDEDLVNDLFSQYGNNNSNF